MPIAQKTLIEQKLCNLLEKKYAFGLVLVQFPIAKTVQMAKVFYKQRIGQGYIEKVNYEFKLRSMSLSSGQSV